MQARHTHMNASHNGSNASHNGCMTKHEFMKTHANNTHKNSNTCTCKMNTKTRRADAPLERSVRAPLGERPHGAGTRGRRHGETTLPMARRDMICDTTSGAWPQRAAAPGARQVPRHHEASHAPQLAGGLGARQGPRPTNTRHAQHAKPFDTNSTPIQCNSARKATRATSSIARGDQAGANDSPNTRDDTIMGPTPLASRPPAGRLLLTRQRPAG